MTQVPEIPDEQRSFKDEAPAPEPEAAAQEGATPAPGPAEPEPEGRFGSLKQYSLNRWSVRDRDL